MGRNDEVCLQLGIGHRVREQAVVVEVLAKVLQHGKAVLLDLLFDLVEDGGISAFRVATVFAQRRCDGADKATLGDTTLIELAHVARHLAAAHGEAEQGSIFQVE